MKAAHVGPGSRGPEDVEALLARLVAEPSISRQPLGDLAACLAERAEDAGLRITRFDVAEGRCNVVARAGPPGTDGLTLSGHMDVVPVEGQQWSSDPFLLTERGDRLVGRGTADMKGFLAAATTALQAIDVRRLQRELALVWTCDEEVGCAGSRHLVEHHAEVISELPRATIIGEPTDLRICRMHPGHTTLRVRCTGRPAHSSRPDLGLSAVRLAHEALGALFELEQVLAGERAGLDELERPWVVLNVGLVSGGSAVNIVPEHCVLDLGLRPLPGQSGALMLARVQEALASVAERAVRDGGLVNVEPLHDAPPLLTPPGTPLERLLAPHATDPTPTGVPFATDGGNLATLGMQCLVFGPGSIAAAHRPDESIGRAELRAGQRAIEVAIRARCCG